MTLLQLILAILNMWPEDTRQVDVISHAVHAKLAAQDDLDPAVLLVIAQHESNLQPARVNRKREAQGKWACGVMQVMAYNPRDCSALLDVHAGYQAGAATLRSKLRQTKGHLKRALNAYACGNAGAAGDRCHGFADMVMGRVRRLTQLDRS